MGRYDLKESPREWNDTLDKFLCPDLKMKRLTTEQLICTFTCDLLSGSVVDDLIISGPTLAMMGTFKQQLQLNKRFEYKDLGKLDRILNIKVNWTAGGGLYLPQVIYMTDSLKRFATHIRAKTTKLNNSVTHMDHKIKLHKGVQSILYLKKIQLRLEKCGEAAS